MGASRLRGNAHKRGIQKCVWKELLITKPPSSDGGERKDRGNDYPVRVLYHKERKETMICMFCGEKSNGEVCDSCLSNDYISKITLVPFEELPEFKLYDYDGCKILNTDWEK